MSVEMDPLNFDFTPANLAGYGLSPVIAGDYLSYRVQYVVDGVAQSLLDAVLVLTLRRRDGTVAPDDQVLQRRSLDNIAGWTPTTKQIAIDADQSQETETGTGKGWYAINFTPPDEAALLGVLGLWHYDVRALFSDGRVRTLLRGRMQILSPRTASTQFTP
jgi:hypothetical protein